MNKVIEAIMSRRGTKGYLKTDVEEEKLQQIVKAGIAAPNAYNSQKWHFTVITRQALLSAINADVLQALIEQGICESGSDYRPLHGAPALIAVSSSQNNEFAKQDCSCANQNMALAAHSLGLASRYLDVPNYLFNGESGQVLKSKIGVPEGYDTICFLCVGYPSNPDEKPAPKNFNVVNYIK